VFTDDLCDSKKDSWILSAVNEGLTFSDVSIDVDKTEVYSPRSGKRIHIDGSYGDPLYLTSTPTVVAMYWGMVGFKTGSRIVLKSTVTFVPVNPPPPPPARPQDPNTWNNGPQ